MIDDAPIFASRRRWRPKELRDHATKHGVGLTDRGEVVVDGEIVAAWELAGGVLVLHDLQPASTPVKTFDLREA